MPPAILRAKSSSQGGALPSLHGQFSGTTLLKSLMADVAPENPGPPDGFLRKLLPLYLFLSLRQLLPVCGHQETPRL